MNWMNLSRLLEATDMKQPTQQVKLISTGLESFEDLESVFKILSLDLESNNIGLAKAKKWMGKMFEIFDEEIDGLYSAHDDLGDAIYYLESSKETTNHTTLKSIVRLLEMDCGSINNQSYQLVKDAIFEMSALERRWFIRYWLRVPRNGINSGICQKVAAKRYNKKLADTKKHCNFNSLSNVIAYYEMDSEPPMNLSHGSFVAPMLAKEVPMEKWPKDKVVDFKYDGNRYQIHKQNESVIIFNRKGKIVTSQFPDVVQRVRGYPVWEAIFDGEIYPVDSHGYPLEHKHMATRVHSKNVQEAMNKVLVKWVIFDCLKWETDTIMNLPYKERLAKYLDIPDQVQRMANGGDVLAFYNIAINEGFEGIIVKDASLPYESGKRSAGWAKYKPPRIELDVVILSAQYGEGKKSNVFATFELGVKSPNGFASVGKVGTGFSDQQLITLTNQLKRNVESFDNGTFKFLPRIVLQVKADLISKDAKGNYGLRFPRMERIRDDKFVADINTLEDVEAMA